LSAEAFDLGFNTRRRIFKITETYVFLRTRLTKIPFGDQALFIRRRHFEQLGGYKDIPIMEDVELMKRIRQRGDRICIIPEKSADVTAPVEQEGIMTARSGTGCCNCSMRWVFRLNDLRDGINLDKRQIANSLEPQKMIPILGHMRSLLLRFFCWFFLLEVPARRRRRFFSARILPPWTTGSLFIFQK
jgi:hypothetical protein